MCIPNKLSHKKSDSKKSEENKVQKESILKPLTFDIYKKYQYTIDRYMELEHCENHKLDATNVNILYAIQDINGQLEKYDPENPELSIYYQLMIKTDFLIGAIETLYKLFNLAKMRKEIWKDDFQTIQKFKLYRSLTLAHPLETTRFEDLGFGDENNKWCKDVRPRGVFDRICDNNLQKADYIIVTIEKGKDISNSISIKDDILPVASIALKHLEIFTKEISSRLSQKTKELMDTPIKAKKDMDFKEYIQALKPDLKIRYPDKIYDEEYMDNTTEEICILNKISEMLSLTFLNPMQEEKYKIYKEDLKKTLYEYGDDVQNMNLEESKACENLESLLITDYSMLSKNSNIHYANEKINSYLSNSNKRSIESAMEKRSRHSYDGCACSGVYTNEEWAIIQLITIKNELDQYFPIDLYVPDKVIYFQYCTALYFAHKSSENKE